MINTRANLRKWKVFSLVRMVHDDDWRRGHTCWMGMKTDRVSKDKIKLFHYFNCLKKLFFGEQKQKQKKERTNSFHSVIPSPSPQLLQIFFFFFFLPFRLQTKRKKARKIAFLLFFLPKVLFPFFFFFSFSPFWSTSFPASFRCHSIDEYIFGCFSNLLWAKV